MSKPKVRVVIEHVKGGAQVTLVDAGGSQRSVPVGSVSERDIQRRSEELQRQARAGGSDVEVVDR